MSERRARPSPAFADLLLAASREQMLGLAFLGMDSFGEKIERSHLGSPQLLRTFLQSNSELASGFLTRTDRSAETLIAALSDPGLRTEPPAAASPGVDHSTASQPIKAAMKEARDTAIAEGRAEWTVGACLAALLADPEAVAREALLAQGIALEPILDWLRVQPDAEQPPEDMMTRMMRDSREMMYRLQPSIMKQVEGEITKTDALADYRRNWASQHRERPTLAMNLQAPAPMPDHLWIQRVGMVREAARWEAASRHAPDVTLEHLLLALTADGTDTSALLDARGIDREAARRELETHCPTFESGPEYPEDSPPLAMAGADEPNPPEPFSDLHSLEAMLWHEEQPAVRLLMRLGITKDVVKAARRDKQLGEGWRHRRPDLASGLRYEGKHASDTVGTRTRAVMNVAEFEARLRGSAQITTDHILLALLSPETETHGWLTRTGIDPASIAQAIDAVLPRSESGKDFPPFAPGAGLLSMIHEVPFSDLAILEKMLASRLSEVRDPSVGLKMLRERDITAEAVRAAMPPTRPLADVMQEELEEIQKRRGTPEA